MLAQKLQKSAGGKAELGVLNEGIIGNRLLNDSPMQAAGGRFGSVLGQAGLKRFERDVLAQSGAKYVIVGLGINDIAIPGSLTPTTEGIKAESIIAGLSAAHLMGPSKGNSNHRHDEPTVRKLVFGFGAAGASDHFLHSGERKDATEGQRLDSQQRRIRRRGGSRWGFTGSESPYATAPELRQWRPPASQQCGLPRRGRCDSSRIVPKPLNSFNGCRGRLTLGVRLRIPSGRRSLPWDYFRFARYPDTISRTRDSVLQVVCL